MKKTKILDVTLRDGGYINDWNFGYDNIIKILNGLNEASIDIIEVGFIDSETDYTINKTKFNNTKQIDSILSNIKHLKSEIVAMIMYGKCDIKNISEKKKTKISGIRVCFKKNQIDDALLYCKKIKEKGYDLYLQPASITDYSDEDIIDLVKKSNILEPKAFYIVDTHGIMQSEDVIKYYYLIDSNLDKNIPIGFHSHNNLQLSFSNSQSLLNQNMKREFYIDSSVFGMGRGAGNLCTELITQYLNSSYEKNYNLLPIMELVDECIDPIFKEKPWGYSVAYYIASINKCHPNYSSYLVNKQTLGVKDINFIMKKIPENKKRNYDENIIQRLYIDYLSNKFDDKKSIALLKKEIGNKNILLLAPGNSIKNEYEKICSFIEKNKPYIISINFIPESIKVDSVFISNMKRIKNINDNEDRVLYTSNVKIHEKKNSLKFNYSSYINDEEYIFDNATLLIINILKKIDINKISIAGFDGYSSTSNNYYISDLNNNMDLKTINIINNNISTFLRNNNMEIDFITTTNYECNN